MHATCHTYTYFTYESQPKPLRSTQKMLAEAAKHPCNETLVFCAEKRHPHAVIHGDNASKPSNKTMIGSMTFSAGIWQKGRACNLQYMHPFCRGAQIIRPRSSARRLVLVIEHRIPLRVIPRHRFSSMSRAQESGA